MAEHSRGEWTSSQILHFLIGSQWLLNIPGVYVELHINPSSYQEVCSLLVSPASAFISDSVVAAFEKVVSI